MKQIIIDRFDGIYAICEDIDQNNYAIETSELPENAKVGSVLEISDDGELTVNEKATEERSERIKGKQRNLFK